MPTLVIDNLGGGLTRFQDGDINSGKAKYNNSWGYDPYSSPGNLTWLEQPTSVMTTSGNGNGVMALSNYYQGQSNYVFAVDAQSSLYQITVSDGVNPNLDTPSVIGALPGANSFTLSAGLTRYGATTEKLYGGADTAIGVVNIDGSNPSVLSSGVANFNTNRPRPFAQFNGKIYFGNGNNIGEIDSTNTITTATKLNPGLPFNTYVVDLDVSPDGNYLIILVNDTILGSSGFDGNYTTTSRNRSGTSRKLYWNGIDASFTAQERFDGLSAFSNTSYADKNILMGYDLGGAGLFSGSQKIVSLPKVDAPWQSAVVSTGNMQSFATTEFDMDDGKLKNSFFQYGQYDDSIPNGLFRLLKQSATVRNDVKSVPAMINVSNLIYSPSIVGASSYISGVSKVYYSTIESNVQAPANLLGKLWRFSLNPTGSGSVMAGVYETQNQLFSKKIKVSEVRVYTGPLVPNNAFTVDLIGSGSSVMAGGSKYFQVGSVVAGTDNIVTRQDVVKFNPAMDTTYSVGIRITNASVMGTKNWLASKFEIDYVEAGT